MSSLPSQRAALTASKRDLQSFRHTDEERGAMYIESFVYHSDYLRETTADVKFPLPVSRTPAPRELNERLSDSSSTLHQEIHRTIDFEHHSVIPAKMRFWLQSKPGYGHGGDEKIHTLVLSMAYSDETGEHQWKPAKRALKRVLEEFGISAEVEILDEYQAFPPLIFPINPEDIHIVAYESFRRGVAAYLDQEDTLMGNWESMCLFRCGMKWKDDDSARFEIVVCVSPWTRADWYQMSRQIEHRFIKNSAATDIGVLFMPGKHTLDDEMTNALSFVDSLQQRPYLGSSIGIRGGDGGGTLGMFVELIQQNGQRRRGFLTSSRAVEPLTTAPESVKRDFYENGISLCAPPDDPRRATVHTMAIKDIRQTRLSAQRRIEDLQRTQAQIDREMPAIKAGVRERIMDELGLLNSSEIDDATFKKELQFTGKVTVGEIPRQEKKREYFVAMGEKIPKGDEKFLQRCYDRVKHAERILELCESLPLDLGTVAYASGRALNSDDHIIDFAFVEISESNTAVYEHATSANALPSDDDRFFLTHWPTNCQYARNAHKIRNTAISSPWFLLTHLVNCPEEETIGDVSKGQFYFKKGRTTDVKGGMCHGTEMFIKMNPESKRSKYDKAGKKVSYDVPTYSAEYVFIALHQFGPIGNDNYTPGNFSEEGDSGAVMINQEGLASALLHGTVLGTTGKPTSRFLVSTLRQMEEDFEGRSGYSMRLDAAKLRREREF